MDAAMKIQLSIIATMHNGDRHHSREWCETERVQERRDHYAGLVLAGELAHVEIEEVAPVGRPTKQAAHKYMGCNIVNDGDCWLWSPVLGRAKPHRAETLLAAKAAIRAALKAVQS